MEIDSPWWIVELKFLIQSASDRIFNGTGNFVLFIIYTLKLML